MTLTIASVLVIVGVAVCLLGIELWASRERRKIQRSRDLMRRLAPYVHQPPAWPSVEREEVRRG